ncbi:outer membrane beta-barrel protein [Niabella beijingensis]|uniref:outer membrane beta-barrel protein n=1 Tax=Niabella beijingensis TaxID=2872700 RepID=UPI001CBCC1D6|nr:outer membrane beta-barrel protein [Niabella beijingensis]MBZ4187309.1 outer membrane beta-barrel protein [Niabella beijingensis]
MRKIVALWLFVFFCSDLCAQLSVKGTVSGDTNTPVAAATIEFYSSGRPVRNIIADGSGAFNIDQLKPGEKYLLQVSAVGYRDQALALQLLNDTVLHIRLTPNSTLLKDVVITGKARLIEVKPDKTVVNLAENPAVVSNSIAETLGKIPGLQMNGDRVSIPGKGEVQLMQDGRLLQLSQKDLLNYLKSIPAGNVSKVEIITSPSAAYDASGNAGLINIITKRNKQQGYNGSIQAGYKQYQQYPGLDVTGNVNYNSGKWNLYANANLFRIRHRYGFRWEEYYPDRSWIMSDTGDYKQHNLVLNAGADYQLSKKSQIGFSVGFSRYFEGGADYVRNHFYNGGGQTDSVLTTYATYVPLARSQSYNLYYKTKLDTTGKTLSVDGSFLTFYRTDESDVTARTFTPEGEPVESSTARFYNNTLQNINIYAVKTDMEFPTRFAKLQWGGKVNFIETYNNMRYYRLTDADKIYDGQLSNEYKYTENTQALYLNGSREAGSWTFQAGLRGELTQTSGYSYIRQQGNKNNYVKLFPNALVNFRKDDQNSFALSYNKRVRRPTFWNLNPYISLLTAYSYYEGNPFLQPEYNSNFQLQHNYKNKLTSSFFVALTNNGFDDITIAHVDTNFVMRTPKNFVNSSRFGISETYNFSAIPWWESNTLFNIYYTSGHSKLDYVEGRKGWGAYFSSSNNFYLNSSKTLSTAVNFWYQFREVTLVNQSDAYYNLDLGFNAVLWRDKLSLNANLQDVFGTSGASYTTVVNGIRQKYANLQLNRNFSLTLIFKFGKKDLPATERVNSNQEERERI